ncbi:MAG TPA: hypothetical protein VFT84_15450 [Gemmatimonadales bacterium]|nr:hypothetical protein [Gemmatimonadales bacterium]
MSATSRAGPRAGPVAGGDWQAASGRDEGGRPTAVLVLPDAAEPAVYHAVLERPAFKVGAGGKPIFSATFVLSRAPGPDETAIAPLVDRAVVSLEADARPSPAVLQSLAAGGAGQYRALFPQRARYVLRLGDTIVAEAQSVGFSAGAALEATLDRPAALELLSAVAEGSSALELYAELEYRESAAAPAIRYRLDLGAFSRRLEAEVGEGGTLTETDLQNYFALAMHTGEVLADPPVAQDWGSRLTAAARALPAFLRAASYIVEAVDTPATELGPVFRLRRRAPAGTTLEFDDVVSGTGGSGQVTLRAPLAELLEPIASGGELDAYMHLVSAGRSGTGFVPVPRRTRAPRERGPVQRPAFAAISGRITPVSHLLHPQATPSAPAHVLLASEAVHASAINRWDLDDLVIGSVSTGDRLESLPVLDDPDAPLWRDRKDSQRFWYAPALEPVLPRPTDQPDSTPFLFLFEPTGHDQEGRPSIEASVRVTIRLTMGPRTRADWEERGQPTAKPVPTSNLSIALEIPFRDGSGTTRRETIRATAQEVNGDTVVATFRLLDNWARVAYGALSTKDYQSEPARVSAAYTFEAYVLIRGESVDVRWGGKALVVPVVDAEHAAGSKSQVQVDASAGAIRFRGGELRIGAPEGNGHGRRARRRPGAVGAATVTATVSPAATTATLAAAHPGVALPVIRPELTTATLVATLAHRQKYARRTEGRSLDSPLLVPCNVHGALYVERRESDRAIGCQDAYKLGEVEPKAYEPLPLPAFAQAPFRVLKSLQVPGRFLLVPATYRIGRFEPSEGEKAYRPTILLYSTIDAEDLLNSRCILMATLVADVAPYWRELLLAELRANHHRDATVELPTELPGEVQLTWGLPTAGGSGPLELEVQGTRAWDGFQVSFITDAAGVPQLQEILANGGVQGSARFILSDGSPQDVTLSVDLAAITGPPVAGPLQIAAEGTAATVTNRIESPVDLSALLAIAGDGTYRAVAVERRLEAGDEVQVDLGGPAERVVPVYTVPRSPASLSEIRSFIEDIAVNAVFINLVDLGAQGLAALRVACRIRGVDGEREVEVTEGAPIASADFLLPLTRYLEEPVLEFRIVKVVHDEPQPASAWRSWNLGTQGSVIGLTRELVDAV